MAQFISIPVTSKGTALISTEGLCTTYSNATTLILASAGKIFTLTLSAATAASLDAVNKAVTTLNGPTVVPVILPNGQTCTNIVIS